MASGGREINQTMKGRFGEDCLSVKNPIRERGEGSDRVRSRMEPQSAVRTIEELKLDAADLLFALDSDVELDAEVTSSTAGGWKDNAADEDDRGRI